MWVIRCRFTSVLSKFANVRGPKSNNNGWSVRTRYPEAARVGCTFVPEPRMVKRMGQITSTFLAEAVSQAQEQCPSLVYFFGTQGSCEEWTKKGQVGRKGLSKQRIAFCG